MANLPPLTLVGVARIHGTGSAHVFFAFICGGPICGPRAGVPFSVGIEEPKHQSLCGLCTSSPEALPSREIRIGRKVKA